MATIHLKRALVSVSDKSHLDILAEYFKNHHIEVISTGGTAKQLQHYGCQVIEISDYTSFPEMMDGRVKTLHPKVHGGLLARLDNPSHTRAMTDHNIESIDLVIVNLYPFEETVNRGAAFEEVIENIDIGGPSMVRSGAKNYAFNVVALRIWHSWAISYNALAISARFSFWPQAWIIPSKEVFSDDSWS